MPELPNATPSPETPAEANASPTVSGDASDSRKSEEAAVRPTAPTTTPPNVEHDSSGMRISDEEEPIEHPDSIDNPALAEAPAGADTAELSDSPDNEENATTNADAATDNEEVAPSDPPDPSDADETCTAASPETDESAPAVEPVFTRNAPGVVLYVFSGIHLGAELELPEGAYLLGSDDSCDIILQGSFLEARHASLMVEADPSGTPSLRVTALDGSVRDDNEAREEIRPAPGAPWYAGLTCLTWNRPGVRQAIPEPRLETFATPVSEATPSPNALAPLAGSAENGTDEAPQPDNKLGIRQTVTANKENNSGLSLSLPPPAKRHALGRFFPLILLIIFLGGLSVVVRPSSPSLDQYPDILDQKLKAAGLSELSAHPGRHGVEVTGLVKDETQLLQLRNMARGLQFPVYLDRVVVRDDMLQAVSKAFETRGFTVGVSLTANAPDLAASHDGGDTVMGEQSASVNGGDSAGDGLMERTPAASQNETQTILVQGYVKDRLLEEGLFAALRQDVEGLPPVTRKMVHQEELAAVLEPAMAKAGLGFAGVDYLPGKVEVKGTFSAENLALLHQILAETEAALGIPLVSAIRPGDIASAGSRGSRGSSGTSESGPAKAGPTLDLPSRQSPDSPSLGGDRPFLPMDVLGGLRVTGVTMSPMRFVTTADGQRLFEGSVLPSGYTLERISTTELTLRKGGQTNTYKLRGAHE